MPIPGALTSPSALFPNGETIVRLRAPLVADPYSGENTLAAWGDPDNPPAELEVPGCAFAPGSSTEPVEADRSSVVTRPAVYAPWGSDILATDRLVVRGRTWEIHGDPEEWRSPFTGWQPGMVVQLEAVEG